MDQDLPPGWISAAPTPPLAPPEVPNARPADPAPRARVGVVALTCAVIGALIGGAVAGGVVAALDDDSTTVVASTTGEPASARPSAALSKPGDIRSILEKVEPAVVRVDVTADPDSIQSRSGTGTGFIVGANGVIVTNAHVADAESTSSGNQLVVTLDDGESIPARLIGEDRAQDLAVIKIARTGLPTVELGDSDSLEVGDGVVAIGNALGIAGSPTVTTGIVSGLGRTVRINSTETLVDAIQTDAAINPGNSGGPLVDVNGRVVGINTAIADPSSSNNVGFAISISSAEPVLADLRAGRTPKIAFMGVSTQTVTPTIVRQHDLTARKGAYTSVVTPGEGADRAGIRTGDVMVEIEGEEIASNDDVVRIVRRQRPGDKLTVVVVRDGARKIFEVTLGDLPSA